MGEASKVYGMLLVMLLAICSFLLFGIYHRKYYAYMKAVHNAEWWRLLRRDPVIDTVGEWIRWPVGSVYLLLSIFNLTETYNDKKVAQYKKKAVFFFVAFIMSFVLVFVIAAALSKA